MGCLAMLRKMETITSDPQFDVLIHGGRIIDPTNGVDMVGDIGIKDGAIAHAGPSIEAASTTRIRIDADGLVVAPGFIDLHSHAQTINGGRLQALDGVTTSLELEGGALPVAAHYAYAAQTGRAINYGFSAGWAAARMNILDRAPALSPQESDKFRMAMGMFEQYQDGARWRGPASTSEIRSIIALLREQLADGAIGIGVLQGYVPDSTTEELHALAALAAETNQPMFVHSRYMSTEGEKNALVAMQELIDASEKFDAPIHVCHLNSTSGHLAEQVVTVLKAAQDRGVRITTEAYPYPAGATVMGAAFLAPDKLRANRMTPSSITYLGTGERIADEERLTEIRATDPGGLCVIQNFDLDDPDQLALLMCSLTYPDAAVASDAMPMVYVGDEDGRAAGLRATTEDVWPLPEGMFAHPRSSGCFAKALSWLVRDLGALSLTDVIRRSTMMPAKILGDAVPAMNNKGHLAVGADADIAVFDADTVAPGGDFTTLRPSIGFQHVLIGGIPLVSSGELVTTALNGAALRGSATVGIGNLST